MAGLYGLDLRGGRSVADLPSTGIRPGGYIPRASFQWTPLPSGAAQAAGGTAAFGTAYNRSWDAVSAGAGIKKIAYNNPGTGVRVSGTRVGVDLTIRADPRMKAFMKRLPKAPKQFKRELRKTLRTAVREEFLKPLRANIPHSGRGKQVTRIARGTKIHRTKRGRTQVYGRKKHIRQTARIAKVEPARIVVTVGSADLWYAAILHKRVPFFPMTVQQAYPKLSARLEKEIYDMMRYLAHGYRKGINAA